MRSDRQAFEPRCCAPTCNREKGPTQRVRDLARTVLALRPTSWSDLASRQLSADHFPRLARSDPSLHRWSGVRAFGWSPELDRYVVPFVRTCVHLLALATRAFPTKGGMNATSPAGGAGDRQEPRPGGRVKRRPARRAMNANPPPVASDGRRSSAKPPRQPARKTAAAASETDQPPQIAAVRRSRRRSRLRLHGRDLARGAVLRPAADDVPHREDPDELAALDHDEVPEAAAGHRVGGPLE